MSVIGIDFGNLDCVIAQAKRGGIDILLNGNSNRKNPNLVCVTGKQRFIGEAAVSVARMHYKNAAYNIKRMIGRQFDDEEMQKEMSLLPFSCVKMPKTGLIGVQLTYDDEQITLTCEQVIAMMMSKLQDITKAANDGVANSLYSVLSVPGFFTDLQRRAMLNATKIAGMNCLRLMNDHTAIALAYGIYKSARNLFDEKEATNVMFIDMGHSAYTVSVVSFVQGKLQVKSASYDRHLGGRDFDLAIAQHVAAQFQEKYKKNPMENPKSRNKLLLASEKAKKNLSPQGVTSTNLSVECLVEEYDYNGKISLEEFDGLVEPFLNRLAGPIEEALETAGLTRKDLSHVEIVGGGTRVASVKKKLSEILELDQEKPNMGLSTTLNADESVARGCALQCAILSPLFKVKEFHVADIVSYPVRISWEPTTGAAMDIDENEDGEQSADSTSSMVILDRKDDFPKIKRVTFRRQESFSIQAQYDETASNYLPASLSKDIGEFKITGFPPVSGEELPKIRVNVKQDLHGIFSVSSSQLMQEIKEDPVAPESTEGKAAEGDDKSATDKKEPEEPKKKRFKKIDLKVEASVPNSLSESDINQMIERELSMAQQDRIIEETANMRNELESYVYEIRAQLYDKYADYVSDNDRTAFEETLQTAEDWLYSDEGFDSTKSVYHAKLQELLAVGNPIDFRYKESSDRPAAQADLLALTEEYKKLANSQEDKHSHWLDEDREKLRSESTAVETWMYDQLALQNELKPNQVPVLTSNQVRSKISDLKKAALPVINKPKPLPPKAPTPEPTPAPASGEGDAPSADTETSTPTTEAKNEGAAKMDLD